MSNRIKDKPLASAPAADDNLYLDGEVNGVRRLDPDYYERKGGPVETNAQTDDYTLVLADAGKLVTMDKGTANTLTIPLNSAVAFEVGTKISLRQLGAGVTSIAATGGVTLTQRSGTVVLGEAGLRTAKLFKTDTDTWELTIDPRDNLAASVDPDADNDTDEGYQVGSLWRNTSGGTTWMCFDNSNGAAVWQELGAGGWVTSILDAQIGATSVISNSTTPTAVYTAPVPANTLRSGSSNRGVVFEAHGVLTNVTGSNRTLVIGVRYGATTIWADTTANIGSSGTARNWAVTGRLFGAGAGNAQVLIIDDVTISPAAAADTGSGDIAGTPITFFAGKGYGTCAEDSTGNLDLSVMMTLSVADANYHVTRNVGLLTRL
jgi:hypothetical protein